MSDLPYTAPTALPPRRKRRRFLWFMLIGSLLLNFYWCHSFYGSAGAFGDEEFPMVSETLSWGSPDAQEKVALIRLYGVIIPESPSTLFGTAVDPVTAILREIRAATVDETVSAMLLEVDSPGGAVTSSDEIYRAVRNFKESREDRKVVVHVKDIAASGGYYAALAADHIVAQPTSIVGSVGVILSAFNMNELGKRFGVEDVSLTSSDNKNLLSPLHPVNPEHRAILQRVVDDLYRQFRGLVLEHRPFDAAYADANSLLDGRVFTAPEALAHRLIDEVGYDDAARAAVARLLGTESLAFYSYSFGGGLASLLQVRAPEIKLPLDPSARFLYLWKP